MTTPTPGVGADYGRVVSTFFVNLSAVSGVKAKQAYMVNMLETYDEEVVDLVKLCLKFAYDDEIRFGITVGQISPPVTTPRTTKPFDRSVFSMLGELATTSGIKSKAHLVESALGELSEHSAELVMKIIGKDLRCGISNSTINKAFPGLLSRFEVMLAKPFNARHARWPVAIEPKLDGLRVVAIVNTGEDDPASAVTFYTRSGKELTSLNNFKEETLALGREFVFTDNEGNTSLATVAFDGEVTSGTFLESMSSVRKGDVQVEEGTFHIFDALIRRMGHSPIALEDGELAKQGDYTERRGRLNLKFQAFRERMDGDPSFVKVVDSYMAKSESEVMAFYAGSREQGFEGIIIKNLNAPYVKKRSSDWMKIKGQETLDLPIVGAFEGEGKYAGMLGGLIVDSEGVQVRVGGGFSDEQRKEYWDAFQEDMKLVEADDRESCVLIDTPVEVEFQEKTPNGSLRHPVFKRLRSDKKKGIVGMF